MKRLPIVLATAIAVVAVGVGLFVALVGGDGSTADAAGDGSRSVAGGEADAATASDAGLASGEDAADAVESTDQSAEAGAGSGQLSAKEIADRIVELDTAIDIPFREGPQPIAISFPSIGVDSSPIDGVGVEPNGEFEVPSAERVGWYEFGPAPGESGSSVLAAHIAAEGVDGVFLNLDEARPGDTFTVSFDTGGSQRYEIIEMAQYDKDELPMERVFARDGQPVVTLITCGGDFNPEIRSYEDNIVAYAVPVAS